MKRILTAMILALAVCSGCSDDGGGDGDGDGEEDGSGSGSGSGEGSTTGQQCNHEFTCINGACSCDGGPKQGQSCCDKDDSSCTENVCDTFCEYCS